MAGVSTITINEKTKERLSDYKSGDWTFDEVPIEVIKCGTFKGISKEEFKSRIKKRASSGS